MKDLTVQLEDRPGTLADLAEALGNAGINIEGIAGFAVHGVGGLVHLLVEDGAAAKAALEAAGVGIEHEADAVVVDVKDQPGELGRIARRIADAGANLTAGYLATHNRLVLLSDDAGKVRAAL
jgi:hypothetical protein